jgi:alpha-galactosidase
MTTLENEVFTLNINELKGSFSIQPKDFRLPGISDARLAARVRIGGEVQEIDLAKALVIPLEQEMVDLPQHGKTEFVVYRSELKKEGLTVQVAFGIVQEAPLVIWKVAITNKGDKPVIMERIDLLKVQEAEEPVSDDEEEEEEEEESHFGFYSNGWQSWSPTSWYSADGHMNFSKLERFQAPMIYNTGTPRPKEDGQFSSDMFAVIGDRVARTGFLVGFLSQKYQFGTIYKDFNAPASLTMWANCDDVRLDPGKMITTDWAVYTPVLLDHRDPLEQYLQGAARENEVHIPGESPVGWCSWYHFYTKVTEKDIRANLRTILDKQETLPIQLVQIDDGFESQVGDWFTFKHSFPDGVKLLAKEISHEWLIPGLWLAPFIVHPASKLARKHRDWLLRARNGERANAGFVWNSLTTALDLTVPEALEYACKVVHTAAKEWEFPYLKLDFLYAAAVECHYKDPTVTRAQVLRKGMEAIRAAAGKNTTILGCGAPLGTMLGLIDANRIGADVSGSWNPQFAGIGSIFRNEPAMPSARNSIRNILTRAMLHRHWWVNDPDCLLIRPNTKLSLAEVRSLAAAISLTGGSLLVSDDLPKLPKDRLRIAEVLLPVIEDRVRVLDWFDAEMPEMLRLDQVGCAGERHILAKFNWSDEEVEYDLTPEVYQLNAGKYWVRDFWNGAAATMSGHHPYHVTIPAHGCLVATVQQVSGSQITYLGSDLHISQGMELAEWKPAMGAVSFTLRLPRKTSGVIYVAIPAEFATVKVNNRLTESKAVSPGVLEIPVQVDGFANVEITIR